MVKLYMHTQCTHTHLVCNVCAKIPTVAILHHQTYMLLSVDAIQKFDLAMAASMQDNQKKERGNV